MTIPELMKFLQVKRNTIYTLRRLGMPTVKIGRSVRFRLDSIMTWLSHHEKSQMSDLERPLVGTVIPDSSHLL
ncbi:MAG TPA: helix-turn-helix domain-containing protein [Candidatus Ozemobacteraceae bacterium]|nr:helix-turn-helix domain-containing protein [Candidatus Ozemobacteraceae bacterium]